MHKTTIKINGAKLRELLENAANASIYEIAEANGFSRNIISNAIREGYASSTVQGIARLYGFERDDYELKDPEPVTTKSGQISIDDLNTISREELKGLVKEAIVETLNSIVCNEVAAFYDPETRVYTVALKVKRRLYNAREC